MASDRNVVQALYDRTAPTYFETFNEVTRYGPRVRAFLRRAVRPDARVLDVGCGPGHLTQHLAPSVTVVGTDLSPGMIELAQQARPHGTYLVHDYNDALPSALGAFDAVLAVGCLDFCEQLVPVLAHLARVMRPGARLLFSVEESRPHGDRRAERTWQADTKDGTLTLYFHTPAAVAAALEQVGLAPIAYRLAPGWTYRVTGRHIEYGFWEAVRA